MSKHFIITVDTEGDNLWDPYQTKDGYREITTKNANVLGDFQALCEKYGFVPTYLTNYEMAINDTFREMASKGLKKGTVEIGMHMHAWNCPPLHDLPYNPEGHNPFQGEYPYDVLKEKVTFLTELLKENFQTEIRSHRAGRWYLDKNVTEILENAGYIVDCSVTPGISWEKTIGNKAYGPNYKNEPQREYLLKNSQFAKVDSKLIEIPPTVVKSTLFGAGIPTSVKELKIKLANNTIWLRPSGSNLKDLLYIVKQKSKENQYLEFMIHSSELMAAGSPNFKTEDSIRKLYSDMDKLFSAIKEAGYEGIGITDYAVNVKEVLK